MLDKTWARGMDAYLACKRPVEDQAGEPGSCDSSEESGTSTSGPSTKSTSRTLWRRAAQRLRRLFECGWGRSLSDFMSYLEQAAVIKK